MTGAIIPPRTELEHICALTGTAPEEWARIPKHTRAYDKGYRWWNKHTGQYARKVITQPEETNEQAAEHIPKAD